MEISFCNVTLGERSLRPKDLYDGGRDTCTHRDLLGKSCGVLRYAQPDCPEDDESDVGYNSSP
jgi:hypothetical protein